MQQKLLSMRWKFTHEEWFFDKKYRTPFCDGRMFGKQLVRVDDSRS
jgi:hypothetical protein